MAKLKVQGFKEKETKNGRKFWQVSGELDGSMEFVTMWEQPEVGKEYEGTTKVNDYGDTTFSLPRNGGGNGYRNDPEVQASIIRQNSLGHAVAVATAHAQLIMQAADNKMEAVDLAEREISFANIIALADMFVGYSSGKVKLGSIEETQGATKPEPNQKVDVSPDEIPF